MRFLESIDREAIAEPAAARRVLLARPDRSRARRRPTALARDLLLPPAGARGPAQAAASGRSWTTSATTCSSSTTGRRRSAEGSSWKRSTPFSAAATSSPRTSGPSTALAEARDRLEAQSPRSEQFVVYRVLDGLTDTFFPVLERLDERMERLDAEIFDRPDPGQLEEITRLRRELVELRRVVTPQRDLLARGVDDILEIPGLRSRLAQLLPRRLRPRDPDLRPDRLLPRPARRHPRRLPLGRLQPPQPDHQAADRGGDDLPAALLRRRLLRPELQVDGPQHRLRRPTSARSGSAAWSSRSSCCCSGSGAAPTSEGRSDRRRGVFQWIPAVSITCRR